MAERWIIEYGREQEALKIVGLASNPAEAASVAQVHFNDLPWEPNHERLKFNPGSLAGDYHCAEGWYRISRHHF
jgi:hypothetical protein